MLDAAREEGGYSVYVRSGFRPYATQAAVVRRWVAEEETHHGLSHPEALARASLSSAREGHSEHQLGTTADLVYRTEKGPIYEGWAPEIIAESAPCGGCTSTPTVSASCSPTSAIKRKSPNTSGSPGTTATSASPPPTPCAAATSRPKST